MAKDADVNRKVYSPDIAYYSMEGTSGLFKSVSSILIGPLRLMMRVPHNIMILPANLLEPYASGLFVVGIVMLFFGAVDYIVFHKWVVLVSQIPVILIALRFKRKASLAVDKAEELREVNIDFAEVTQLCQGVYDELDKALGKD